MTGRGADDAAWDEFVESSPTGAYTQLTAWARVKRPNGWQAARVVAEDGSWPVVGAQLLRRALGPTPWAVGYAPRGPVAASYTELGMAAFTEAAREAARRRRLTHVTIDPEVEAGHELEEWLRRLGWRPAAGVQPDRTRLVDLGRSEEELWADLRSKWRQYVQKARRSGVVVYETGAEGIDDFYRIYVETARRAGFVHRARSAYGQVYDAYAAGGRARLLFAGDGAGTPLATLMLLHCGRKVIEPYGGMTTAGAEKRANYLLKWEAIRTSRERGFGVYDMWGLAHGGIEHFKAGFGGREVRYIGAWELVANPLLRTAVNAARRGAILLARRVQRIEGGSRDAG